MQQLSAIDTLFVSGESENMPMHIGALSIYQSQTRQYFSRVTTVFEQRLGHSPIFRRKLVEPPFKLQGSPAYRDRLATVQVFYSGRVRSYVVNYRGLCREIDHNGVAIDRQSIV